MIDSSSNVMNHYMQIFIFCLYSVLIRFLLLLLLFMLIYFLSFVPVLRALYWTLLKQNMLYQGMVLLLTGSMFRIWAQFHLHFIQIFCIFIICRVMILESFHTFCCLNWSCFLVWMTEWMYWYLYLCTSNTIQIFNFMYIICCVSYLIV